jgi:tripartite-type tricarboxylate transporter receptor subunit TctC
MVTGTVPALNAFIKDGRVKALAVTASKRSSALPDVPSMAESGLASLNTGFDVLNYFGLMAPKATPAAAIERLNAALGKVLQMSDVRARFASDALEPVTTANGSPAQLANFIEKDFSSWRQVVAAQNLKIDAA